MDNANMPVIRLTIEQMKASILTHLGIRNSELGELIESQIDRAMEVYPWEEEVNRIVNKQITETIEAYFKYGQGSTAIKEAITEALSGVVQD